MSAPSSRSNRTRASPPRRSCGAGRRSTSSRSGVSGAGSWSRTPCSTRPRPRRPKRRPAALRARGAPAPTRARAPAARDGAARAALLRGLAGQEVAQLRWRNVRLLVRRRNGAPCASWARATRSGSCRCSGSLMPSCGPGSWMPRRATAPARGRAGAGASRRSAPGPARGVPGGEVGRAGRRCAIAPRIGSAIRRPRICSSRGWIRAIVQRILGHESIVTTMQYTQVTNDAMMIRRCDGDGNKPSHMSKILFRATPPRLSPRYDDPSG